MWSIFRLVRIWRQNTCATTSYPRVSEKRWNKVRKRNLYTEMTSLWTFLYRKPLLKKDIWRRKNCVNVIYFSASLYMTSIFSKWYSTTREGLCYAVIIYNVLWYFIITSWCVVFKWFCIIFAKRYNSIIYTLFFYAFHYQSVKCAFDLILDLT